jgi:hypothetical protein
VPFQDSTKLRSVVVLAYAPAAEHALALGHDTLERDHVVAPAGMGVGATLQTVPFQVSVGLPAATQFVAAVHATLGSTVPKGKVVCRVHVDPSHVSAKLLVGIPNRPIWCPIVMQKEGDAQETPSSTPPPDGLGADWMVQELPFHASTRGPLPHPTATQMAEPMQVTPARVDNTAPDGFGVDCSVHEVPFHASARVSPV